MNLGYAYVDRQFFHDQALQLGYVNSMSDYIKNLIKVTAEDIVCLSYIHKSPHSFIDRN